MRRFVVVLAAGAVRRGRHPAAPAPKVALASLADLPGGGAQSL
ncbi:MAG: hypothetical protein WDM81_08310 [Rhizomicrobium sp.]